MIDKIFLAALEAIIRRIFDEKLPLFKADPPKPPETLMTIAESCAFLQISAPTLRRLVRDNELSIYRLGKSSVIRLKKSEVDAALKNIRYLKNARKPL
jgi:excisionase family DNA binding protein